MAAIAVAIAVVLAAGLWRYQERIVFRPPGPPFPEAGGARRIDFTASDGQALFAYLVGQPDSGLVIVFHGNADLAGWQMSWARELSHRTGRAVLLPEYRGYAGLGGVPTYAASALDARAAYSLARDTLHVPARRIALYGHSLGTAIAAELARDVAPEVLILVSPLTSARDIARRISVNAVLLYRTGLARVHYDTERIVRMLDAPVWVAHGARDSVLPVEMGRRVFAAARVKGELLVIDAAEHNDLLHVAGERYWQWLERALQRPD
jgi:fermentation-respiration switch protein FrsA (DUF1100 family)